MTKPFIPISEPSIGPLEIEYVTDAVKSTWISSIGPYINRFESEFAKFCGTKHAIAVSNGTVAIHLALVAHGIKPGDEVIMPNLSFIATANAVYHAGAIPIFVDIDPVNLGIDAALIEQHITAKTKAIMPVHLYGHPANMVEINKVAEKYSLIVIEDAAEAHGAQINGKTVGSWGHSATFSFYGNKNLTTGEGGMITTNDDYIADRCKFLRDHAMTKEKRYWHTEVGYNYRMTNLQAALGCAQLSRIHDLLGRRQWIFNEYMKRLGSDDRIVLNRTETWATNSYWLICVEIVGLYDKKREQLMQDLKAEGVDSRPYFYPTSEMPYINEDVNTPVTFEVAYRGLNLPTFFGITEAQIERVCKTLLSRL